MLPLLPYLLGATSLAFSAVLAGVALFAAGALSSRFTRRTALFAGSRQFALGVIAAAVTFGIGVLFHVSVG
jgi:VIT1/CCC1 family predicted Fe2+/Mn2+ transporter